MAIAKLIGLAQAVVRSALKSFGSVRVNIGLVSLLKCTAPGLLVSCVVACASALPTATPASVALVRPPDTSVHTSTPTPVVAHTPTPKTTDPSPRPDSLSTGFLALTAPDAPISLFLFFDDLLRDPTAPGAIRNLGYRLSAEEGTVVIVEVVGREQMVQDVSAEPSIFVPSSARHGDRVLLFAITPYGKSTRAVEFTIASEVDGWRALNLIEASATPALHIALASATPEVVDPNSTLSLEISEQEVTLQLESIFVTPGLPQQGQPYTVTAVIRNLGATAARAPVWLGVYDDVDAEPIGTGNVFLVTVPGEGTAEVTWATNSLQHAVDDFSREHASLTFHAGVNVLPPGRRNLLLQSEIEKSDNSAEISVDFLPYQPLVTDACPPSDNLWLSASPDQATRVPTPQSSLRVMVYNEGNAEIVRVPLRAIDAAGQSILTYVSWVPPCGGNVTVDVQYPTQQITYPITLTLNPADAPAALSESDHADNTLVVSAIDVCSGSTDLWLMSDDVGIEGDDVLVTIHLSGSPPRSSFYVRVYHTREGINLANESLRLSTCDQTINVRFKDVLVGRRGGHILVQIDTEMHHSESVYPQHNNTASIALP